MAITRPSTENAINPWWVRLPLLVFSGLVLLLVTLVILVALFQLRYRDRILPGVSAYGLDLGGMTEAQAADAIGANYTYGANSVFTFRYNDRFWQATAADLGVSFDVQSTVDAALESGRGRGLLFNLADQALIWLNGQTIDPLIQYDQTRAAAWLATIASEIDLASVDASLEIVNLEIRETPARVGRYLDIRATLRQLDSAILGLIPGGEIPLVVTETRPIGFDAEAAAEKARIAISAPLVLTAESPNGAQLGPWSVSVDQIAQLLRVVTVQGDDGVYRYDVAVDMDAFHDSLTTLAPGLIAGARNAKFYFDEESRQLELFEPSFSGRALNVASTLERMEEAVFTRENRIVPLAFDYTTPLYPDNVTAQELGIRELVSEATTYFTGSSAARRTNIIQAAAQFDGVIIAPNQTFSFNSFLGNISPEEGFVSGKVIVGGRTVDGVGGGVCQVSTTAFQAAFYAGYPVVERYAHGYRVGYYEQGEGVGMDAAIYQPGPDDSPYAQELDFRFVNDTPYHLLIETDVYPETDAVQFRFYSTDPGRQVVKVGPEIMNVTAAAPTIYEVNPDLNPGESQQVDYAAQGSEVRVQRLILDSNGAELRSETFYSNYQPWGAVIQVAPGDARATE